METLTLLPPCPPLPPSRREMSMIAAHAAWHMGQWEEMEVYVETIDNPEMPSYTTATGAFLRAVLCIRKVAARYSRTAHIYFNTYAAHYVLHYIDRYMCTSLPTIHMYFTTCTIHVYHTRVLHYLYHMCVHKHMYCTTSVPRMPTSIPVPAVPAPLQLTLLPPPPCALGLQCQYDLAKANVERAREMMSTEFAALVSEGAGGVVWPLYVRVLGGDGGTLNPPTPTPGHLPVCCPAVGVGGVGVLVLVLCGGGR